MVRKKTQKQAEIEARLVNAELLTPYINSYTPHGYLCLKCGYKRDVTPNNIQQKRGCPKCINNNLPKTQEQAEREASLAGFRLLTPYINNTTACNYCCLSCGHELSARPANVQQLMGCLKCAGRLPKTQEQAESEARLVGAEMLTDYVGSHKRHDYRCLTCKHEWTAVHNNIQQKQGCLKCCGKMRKTQEQAEREALDAGCKLLSIYFSNDQYCRYGCLKCKHEWETVPSRIQQGTGCSKCKLKTQSKIFDFVKTLQADFIWEPGKVLDNGQRPDMYSPFLNLIVEYDGEQHFKLCVGGFGCKTIKEARERLQKQLETDLRFNAQCQEQGIDLIRIPYYDYQKDPEGTLAGLRVKLSNRLRSTNQSPPS